ncbi:MAG TPA: site-specific integrase [Lacipirellulaceae bacterium]
MATATLIKKPRRLRRLEEGPLGVYIDLFSARLLKEGHCQQSAWRNIKVVGDFSRWLARKGIAAERIDEDIVQHYMRFRARCRHPSIFDRPALNRLLAVLHEADVIAPKRSVSSSALEQIAEDFRRHLSQCGGYATTTIISHLPTLRRFLSECCPEGTSSFRKLVAADITGFVTRHAPEQSTRSTQRACWTLRSFLRYLRYKDLISIDLSGAVPSVRTWRFRSLPKYLSPAQVEKVLSAVDRTAPLGRRDYAILLLLARLGLRASEVATLCLEDIDWRSGELTVRGKGRQRARMPLPTDVGTAIADYLHQSRPQSESRRVFLREWAPHIGFSSGTNVTAIAWSALTRAGVDAPSKGAHVFRHSLATQLLRAGASLTEIGQLLRHRSHDSTRIYAKVDLGALRTLAMRWPGGDL